MSERSNSEWDAETQREINQRATRRLIVAASLIAVVLGGLAWIESYTNSNPKNNSGMQGTELLVERSSKTVIGPDSPKNSATFASNAPTNANENPMPAAATNSNPPFTIPESKTIEPKSNNLPPPAPPVVINQTTPAENSPGATATTVNNAANPAATNQPNTVLTNKSVPEIKPLPTTLQINAPAPISNAKVNPAPITSSPPSTNVIAANPTITPPQIAQPTKPVAPTKPEVSKPVVTSVGNGYSVQFGVFTSLENARSLLDKLKNNGIPAHTETRVQLGPFANKLEAQQAIEKAKNLGVSAVIVGK